MFRKTFLMICLGVSLSLYGKRYAPYPILFCHGAGSKASAALSLFGVNENDLNENPFENGLGKFFYQINPWYPRWDFYGREPGQKPEIDGDYDDTKWYKMQCFAPIQLAKYDTLGPYLHAFSFKRNVRFCIPLTGCENKADGSIDYDPDGSHYVDGKPYEGQGAEVVKFCKLVLDKRGG